MHIQSKKFHFLPTVSKHWKQRQMLDVLPLTLWLLSSLSECDQGTCLLFRALVKHVTWHPWWANFRGLIKFPIYSISRHHRQVYVKTTRGRFVFIATGNLGMRPLDVCLDGCHLAREFTNVIQHVMADNVFGLSLYWNIFNFRVDLIISYSIVCFKVM